MIMGGGGVNNPMGLDDGMYERQQHPDRLMRHTKELLNPEKSKRRSKLWLMAGGATGALGAFLGIGLANPGFLHAGLAGVLTSLGGYAGSKLK